MKEIAQEQRIVTSKGARICRGDIGDREEEFPFNLDPLSPWWHIYIRKVSPR